MSNYFNDISTITKSHSKICSVHVNQTIKILIDYQFFSCFVRLFFFFNRVDCGFYSRVYNDNQIVFLFARNLET